MRPLLFALAILFSQVAIAQDLPCSSSPDGKSVVCETEGFGLLVKSCVEDKAGLEECNIKLTAVKEQLSATKTALDKCITTIPPVPPTPEKKPITKPIIGYIMGVAGAATIATGVALDSNLLSTGSRLGVAGIGLTLAVSGLFFVLPWD